MPTISIVLPAKNEATNLGFLLPKLVGRFVDAEVIVVDDGSSDDTSRVAKDLGARVIRHPYSMGNGAAIKTGARNAAASTIIFMDADGQHDPEDIPHLLARLDDGYEMVIGARSLSSHATLGRRCANLIFNRMASWMAGYAILDLTSGFRAVRARHFRKFLYLLPNGFSYPTTSTMAFFRSGLPVAYVPIEAKRRTGKEKSKIRPLQDGARFFLIILKIGALFSPMRLFLPVSALLATLGLSLYLYNYFTVGRFTNMSVLLLMSSLFTFLIGILSEQVSSLHYRGMETDRRVEIRPTGEDKQ